jgi:hypothetical protein
MVQGIYYSDPQRAGLSVWHVFFVGGSGFGVQISHNVRFCPRFGFASLPEFWGTGVARGKKTEAGKSKELIPADELERLTGLTDRRHRQIAEEGFFAKPEMGRYLREQTLAGMFRYFRESNGKDSLTKERVLLTREKRIGAAKDNAVRDGELESKKAIAGKLFALGEEIKSTLNFHLTDRLPALNAGLDATAQRVNNRAVMLEILRRWQEFAGKWIAAPAEPAKAA